MEKSPDAFRTISEVADWLGVPTHVLRFWESRFPQVKPVKRAGGRRYYRPADMMLLGGIKRLLHDDGMTIRGVQKMLREDGVKHVSSFSQPLDALAALRDVTPEEEEVAPSPMAVDVEPEPLDNVVPMGASPPAPAEAPAQEPEPETADAVGEAPEEPLVLEKAEPEAVLPPEPAEAEVRDEAADEKLPEFSFLRRAQPEAEAPLAPTTDEDAPQPDLFASRRSAEPPAPSPAMRPRIPATPDVPIADAADDDPSTPALPGLAARLLVHPIRPDHAAIAHAVAELRAVRTRL
jgi:DNA-binding transcriptional MerR regulator